MIGKIVCDKQYIKYIRSLGFRASLHDILDWDKGVGMWAIYPPGTPLPFGDH